MRRTTRGRLVIGLVVVLAVLAVVLGFVLGGVATGIGVAVVAVLAPLSFYYRFKDMQPQALSSRR